MALPRPVDGAGPRYFGLYPASVTDLVDRDGLGRVEVQFPWLADDGSSVRAWATLCTPYADKNQGYQMLPEVGSQVVVGFEAGDLRRPYVVGAAWNGSATQPETPTNANNLRLIQSRTSSRLEFDDTPGAEKVRVTMQVGHEIVLDQTAQEITITSAAGCSVKVTATSVEISGNVSVDVTAPMVKVDAPIAQFSGLVKVGTLIAEQMVMSPAYTPGAGNIL